MKHVLGMAKSALDLRGAKGPKLELDYLRLLYAVKELRKQGDNAQGYLIVLTEPIQERTRQWENKYLVGGDVKVICPEVSSSDKAELENEKANNVAGMVAGTTGEEVRERSSANLGREIGEKALRREIFESEPNVEEVTDKSKFPFDIRWDFYGVIDKPQTP